MKVQKGKPLTLSITGTAFGGKGLAKVDGLAIFVDQAVPGDVVLARITRKKKNYAEARVVELLEPSAYRVPAPCPYSGHCGGCKWQFLAYGTQLEFKRLHVVDSLEHIAMLQGVPVHPVIPSEEVFGYRNKMEFSFSDRRWLMPAEMKDPAAAADFALGLHVPGTFDKVLDTRTCLLQPELGNRILDDVRAFAAASRQPVYGLKSHQGFWRFLMLRHSKAHDEWMVNLITSAEDPEETAILARRLTEKYSRVTAVVNNITARKAGIAVGEYEILLAGRPFIEDRIGPFAFEISANSFFQTNTLGAERLYRVVREFARLTGRESVLDLYCGTGTIGIWLADAAREVTGVEIAASAVADARKNCRVNGVENVGFIQGDIEKGLEGIAAAPDVLVVDPPRAGMHKDVVKRILAMAPARMVYVSCNPATLARDLTMLREKYTVAEAQPVDMFPHTYHIETVVRLERQGHSQEGV